MPQIYKERNNYFWRKKSRCSFLTQIPPREMCPIDAEKQVEHSVSAAKWENRSGLTIKTPPPSARLCPRLGWRSRQPACEGQAWQRWGDAADDGQATHTSTSPPPSPDPCGSMWSWIGYQVTGATRLNSPTLRLFPSLPAIGTSACTDPAASHRGWSLWAFRVKDCGCREAWPTKGWEWEVCSVVVGSWAVWMTPAEEKRTKLDILSRTLSPLCYILISSEDWMDL